MFRVNHLLRISNAAAKTWTRSSFEPSKYLGLQSVTTIVNIPRHIQPRFYSKDGPKEPTCAGKDKKVEEKEPPDPCDNEPPKPKIVLKECKPVDILPCQPPPPEPASKIPYLDECAKPDLEKECPQPICEDEPKTNPYQTAIIWGLLIAAATLASLWAAGFFGPRQKKESKLPPKKVKKKPKRVCKKQPATSAEIPTEVPYLLIGGGTASFSAFRAIKSAEPTAKVLVVSSECFYPYMRPPLSKEMWFNEDKEAVKKLIFKQWNGSERHLYYEPEDFYIKCGDLMSSANGGVAVALGYNVSHIDVLEKVAYLDDGHAIHYDKCLVATDLKSICTGIFNYPPFLIAYIHAVSARGQHDIKQYKTAFENVSLNQNDVKLDKCATPKTLGVFEAAASDPVIQEKVKFFRNIYDFEDVFDAFEESKAIAIVGGGFLGSELACALSRKGKKKKYVYQIFRENGNMGKILPEYLSSWTTEKVKAEGVEVLSNSEVIGVKSEKDKVLLVLSNGQTLSLDQVVVAVGVEPNTALAEKSDLEVDAELGGFLVNTELQARTDLYIAGDCACFYDVRLGRRRIEHHDHAVVTGRLAGENMTGKANPYLHQSMFWSDLGPDVGYEAIGIIDSSLPTVGVFAKMDGNDNSSKSTVVSDSSGGSGDNTAKPEDYNKGIIFYLRDDLVVGIVLWNVFNRMSIARQVLKDERKYEDLNEVAKLFNIHEE